MTMQIISLGGGVQSTVMALMASAGQLEPMPEAAIFADTQWEHPAIYEHIDWLEGQLKFPLHRVTAGDISEDLANGVNSTGQQFFSVPVYVRTEGVTTGRGSLTRRQCTREYKLEPILRLVRREFLGLPDGKRAPKGTSVTQWIGISTDEISRARVGPINGQPPWLHQRYPLLEAGMSRLECIDWFWQHHPDRELRKSSCLGCPYHDDQAWADLAEDDPDLYAQTAEVEARARQSEEARGRFGGEVALHRSMVPLGEIDWASRPKQQTFDDLCDGYCWT